MYHMKNIVPVDSEITLPKCMYGLKKVTEPLIPDEMELNIRNQVITFLKQAPSTKMTELEERQDQLLRKLDILYDRIKAISSNSNMVNNNVSLNKEETVLTNALMDEVVIVLSPDSLPWFLNIYRKQVGDVTIAWHIHSSVPNEKKPKIQAFFKRFTDLYPIINSRINVRLIFKSVAVDSELKLSSLEIPIVGNVNIMRYLALTYPNIVPYNFNDHQVDSLLDLCCLLERSPEKNKEAIIKKLFSENKTWIYENRFSIVDLAVYNTVKQWQNSTKYVPKAWFDNCEKIII